MIKTEHNNKRSDINRVRLYVTKYICLKDDKA